MWCRGWCGNSVTVLSDNLLPSLTGEVGTRQSSRGKRSVIQKDKGQDTQSAPTTGPPME